MSSESAAEMQARILARAKALSEQGTAADVDLADEAVDGAAAILHGHGHGLHTAQG